MIGEQAVANTDDDFGRGDDRSGLGRDERAGGQPPDRTAVLIVQVENGTGLNRGEGPVNFATKAIEASIGLLQLCESLNA